MLETARLVLRPWRVAEAAVQRDLWAERDPRVPPHRRIDRHGNPTIANTPSRRVLAKLGFEETDRTEVDPARGTTLVTMRGL